MNYALELTRYLNDEFRRDFTRGVAFMTPGVEALGPEKAERIINAVALHKDSLRHATGDDEGDFGELEIDGCKIFWKIDYFTKDMTMASPDPSDPSATKRVITMMLPQEY